MRQRCGGKGYVASCVWLRHTDLTRGLRPRCIPQENDSKMQTQKRDWSKIKRKKAPHQVSVRLTPEENAQLEIIAERLGVSKAGYVKSAALGRPIPKASRRPQANEVALRQLLGLMGKLGSNANQIARLCNSGTITDHQTAISALQGIKAEMADIRALLLDALNVKS